MMYRLWSSVAVLAALLFATLFNTVYLRNFTESLVSTLQQAQENVSVEDRDTAIQKTREAMKLWNSHEGYLHITLNHGEIDDVLLSFHEVEQLLISRETGGEYYSANAQLITRIQLLYEMEAFTLKNLF